MAEAPKAPISAARKRVNAVIKATPGYTAAPGTVDQLEASLLAGNITDAQLVETVSQFWGAAPRSLVLHLATLNGVTLTKAAEKELTKSLELEPGQANYSRIATLIASGYGRAATAAAPAAASPTSTSAPIAIDDGYAALSDRTAWWVMGGLVALCVGYYYLRRA
jgi:hypothetical protein